MRLLPTLVFLSSVLMLPASAFAAVEAQATISTAPPAAQANLPATDVSATRSSPLVWLGPITMGVFAFILVFAIRRYSKPRRQDMAQEDVSQKPIDKRGD